MNFNQSGQSKTLAMTRSNIGNISNVNLNGTGTARSYSNAHELTSVGGSSQTFDADGNLTAATNGNTFAWDEAGMMTQANVSGGPTVEYGYGGGGKRIWKKVGTAETVYVHAGPNCIAEYTKGSAPASSGNEYVYAGAIDSLVMLLRSSGSQKLAVTRNQQWSVSALVNTWGSVVERYTYDHFGKRTILAANGSTVRTGRLHVFHTLKSTVSKYFISHPALNLLFLMPHLAVFSRLSMLNAVRRRVLKFSSPWSLRMRQRSS